ncbi:polysaccharide pyruvyl transferase family protein [Lysobacter sp. S4-A87]|uniref:polysaccharide pyruvyl transferase family protein n=1 Tax=Lysobacter sp. S4-A87 TaxID=2925843 RepID=UPI001F5386AF|nr:polysaccharide pyruvyl transferase family protein [Lysobacter sp. S4-A87]UNK49949.1 polysaccharide pyruvyl transferase family protein [Lysobacter sp. S4-A87]
MRNFGDDLFGVLCTTASRLYWHAEPTLVGPPLADIEGGSTWPKSFPLDLYGAAGVAGKCSRLLSFVRGMHGNDVLVMGGGSVITARESFRKPLMLWANRRRRLQLAAVGVSIGPFVDEADEAVVADYARHFSYLSVRDRRSYELALRLGLDHVTHHGRDLAGLLSLLMPTGSARGGMRLEHGGPLHVGIAPCRYTPRSDHPAPTMDAWRDAAIEALAAIAVRTPLQVEVFSLNGHHRHGDEVLAEAMQSRLRERGINAGLRLYRGHDPLATVRDICRCDAFISARLHGAIVAYLCGVPFTIIDYHPKCRDFADDIGLPASLRISGGQGADDLVTAITTMLNDPDARPGLSPSVYAQQAQDIFQCAPWSSRQRSDLNPGNLHPGNYGTVP